jgi:hypothetical protein
MAIILIALVCTIIIIFIGILVALYNPTSEASFEAERQDYENRIKNLQESLDFNLITIRKLETDKQSLKVELDSYDCTVKDMLRECLIVWNIKPSDVYEKGELNEDRCGGDEDNQKAECCAGSD